MNFKHLTESERYKIEVLLLRNVSVKEIALTLGKCPATIYNEVKRGTVELFDSNLKPYRKYCADVGQRVYEEKSRNKGRNLKVNNDYEFLKFVEKKIGEEKYSPFAVLCYIKNNNLHFRTTVCFKTLYNYIDSGVFLNLSNKDLPVKTKHKRCYKKIRSVALKNLKGTSIEKRPACVLDRKSFGHWEMDTVYSGKQTGKECLLVLSERMARIEKIFKMPDRTQSSVVSVLDNLEKKLGHDNFANIFKTITCDNGVEFLDFESIENGECGKRTTLYYCHPFCSSERGTNENINKMIRRWIPKGKAISLYSDENISRIEKWINNYPRKILGSKSSVTYLSELGLTIDLSVLIKSDC